MQHYTRGLTNDMLVHIQINGNNMAYRFPKPPSPVPVAFLFLLRELETSFKDCKVWVISLTASAHEELLSSCQWDCVFNNVPHQKSRVITVTKPLGPARCSWAHVSFASVAAGLYNARGIPSGDWRNAGCIAFHHLTNAIPNSAESAIFGGCWYSCSWPRAFAAHFNHSSGRNAIAGSAACDASIRSECRKAGK